MRVAIRVDAGALIGVGHLVRCLTLADALRERGGVVSFFSRPLPIEWQDAIRARGHRLADLPGPPPPGDFAADIEWSRRGLAGTTWDWVVVDHYGLDAAWERAVPTPGAYVMVIDDLANRGHACDLLLDQNYQPGREEDYRPLVPSRCRLLMGPTFALLKPEYARYRAHTSRSGRALRNVLVFFGGTDPCHLTERAVEALAHDECADLAVTIVSGADRRRREALDAAVVPHRHIRVVGLRQHLADLMAEADVALGAGGATTWERLCLGLPSIVVTTAENQERVSALLAREGLIVLLGAAAEVTPASMRAAVMRLRDSTTRPDVARGMALCDGGGAARVADAMVCGAGLEGER